jgi:hypothetical protein
MALRDTLKEAELLVRSRHSLLVLDTMDEPRIRALVSQLAERLGLPLFQWSPSRGLVRLDLEGRTEGGRGIYGSQDAGNALDHIASSSVPALYHFHGLPAGTEPGTLLASRFRDAVQRLSTMPGAILLTGSASHLPPDLEALATPIDLPAPSRDELRQLIGRIIRDYNQRRHLEVTLSPEETQLLIAHLTGLSTLEAEKILTRAIVEDGILGRDDLKHVLEAKRALVEREGLLEYYPLEESLVEVAGMDRLKDWLRKRAAILTDPDRAREFGLTFPRGMLLLGIPGSGKSLAAKTIAGEWGLPLIKLDPSNLYDKYIGESEKNFKQAMATAERMAPVVLWIDEIEKAFASGGSEDGGVSQRILGSFLGWLQERRGDVFIAATANDISRLPPELLRKGRFDEIFFVDLPNQGVRSEIFRIHLAARNQDPSEFDLSALARATEGFSGAEIEQVVVSGLYSAFSADIPLSTDLLLEEVVVTRPLSETASASVAALRAWAAERAVAAG